MIIYNLYNCRASKLGLLLLYSSFIKLSHAKLVKIEFTINRLVAIKSITTTAELLLTIFSLLY